MCVVGRPVAQQFDPTAVFEVTRLAIGPDAPQYAASRLLGAARRAALAMGFRRGISYTRADERGSCYIASGWWVTARVAGRAWNTGNKRTRWLPGVYEPTTEIVDRMRWETGPEAAERMEDER